LGESQEKLADACGLHWTFIGQVERGQRNLSLHNILKLADGLQIDAADLIRGLHAPNSLGAIKVRNDDAALQLSSNRLKCRTWTQSSYAF